MLRPGHVSEGSRKQVRLADSHSNGGAYSYASGGSCSGTSRWVLLTLLLTTIMVGQEIVAWNKSMRLGMVAIIRTDQVMKVLPSDAVGDVEDSSSKLSTVESQGTSTFTTKGNVTINLTPVNASHDKASKRSPGTSSVSSADETVRRNVELLPITSPPTVPLSPSKTPLHTTPISASTPVRAISTTNTSNATAIVATAHDPVSDLSMQQQFTLPREYPHDGGNDIGFLSALPLDYFHDLQQRIDDDDNIERCKRYRFTYPTSSIVAMSNNTRILPTNDDDTQPLRRRRIFYGALMASEPWELYEIVGAETYGVFEAMVFVESNRTQNFYPRNFTHLDHASILSQIYGVPVEKIQIRSYIDESPTVRGLNREQQQRAEILYGWKELGMQPTDIGYLADADETFTRDFFRAVQVCDKIPALEYHKHHCHYGRNGIRARTMVFETSPECITQDRSWFHPDMFVGACIEEIGDEKLNPKAPRAGKSTFFRAKGYGNKGWAKVDNITDNRYPLYNAADFRRIGGGRTYQVDESLVQAKEYGSFTGYHFHNFFVKPDAIRFKYLTYGHPDHKAYEKTLDELHRDIAMAVRCMKHLPDPPDEQHRKRVVGGFESVPRFKPIYFHDPIYRRHRHDFIREQIVADEAAMMLKRNITNKTDK
jgi:hypothetical protein